MKKRSYFLTSLAIPLLLLTLASCKNDVKMTDITPDPTPVVTTPPVTTTTTTIALCGWVRKIEKTCSTGVKYIYGLSSCASDGRSIFCKKALETNYSACLADQTPETLRCRCELLGVANAGCY